MVQEQQGRVLGMLDSLSLSTQAALAGLEARVLDLEAKADTCLPGGVTVYCLLIKHNVYGSSRMMRSCCHMICCDSTPYKGWCEFGYAMGWHLTV